MLNRLRIVIRGAGDLATGVALRLFHSGFTRLVMLERENPMAVRRLAAFSEAVRNGRHTVEDVTAELAHSAGDVGRVLAQGRLPVLVDPLATSLDVLKPDVLVDAVMAKRNLGTSMRDAPLVIGLGPGFTAGRDCHRVIETHRGSGLGRVIAEGGALPDTGIPGAVMGYTTERVLRAPVDGIFETRLEVGHVVQAGEAVGLVAGRPVVSQLSGVLRGILPDLSSVSAGLKVGDVDPRGDASTCDRVSDKALAVGGGVLEAILERFNTGADIRLGEEGGVWPLAIP